MEKEKLKILVISQYFWPENFRINDLTLNLKKQGYDVKVLTGEPNYPDGNIYKEYLKKRVRMMNDNGLVKKPIEKIEEWMEIKKSALRLFGKDSVEYIFAETQLDFLLKENDLELHEMTIGFMKKK